MKLQGTMKINNKGHLEISGCDTVDLAANFGTPLYVMDEAVIRQNCQDYYRSFVQKYTNAEVIYASKTFLTMAMCRIIEEEGLGLDVVSGGEIYTALQAGFPSDRIYFHGNNKTPEELALALEAKVGHIVVDNPFEMDLLDTMAREQQALVKILLRITPGIDAHTHDYVKTGHLDSKFGMAISTGQAVEGVKKALSLKNLDLVGMHCHIGSQIFELDSYRHAAEVMMDFLAQVKAETGYVSEVLNLGGGFGIYYFEGDTPAKISDYADLVMATIQRKAAEIGTAVPKIIVEPGRSIAGPAGTTLYTVGSVKHIPGVRTYVAVNGGMTDNPRPALYGSKYEAVLANKANKQAEETVSIAGKCCESGDMLIWDIQLPKVESGDLLAVAGTGAYNYSMSSNYNRIPKPAVVLVNQGKAELILKRETYGDITRNDVIPQRLAKNDTKEKELPAVSNG